MRCWMCLVKRTDCPIVVRKDENVLNMAVRSLLEASQANVVSMVEYTHAVMNMVAQVMLETSQASASLIKEVVYALMTAVSRVL
jgi:hypothetical protein